MQFLKNNGRCPYCNKSVQLFYEPRSRYIGSPVRTCKKCGQCYGDRRYRELAVEEVQKSEFSYISGIVMIVVGCLVAYRGIYLFGWKTLGSSGNIDWIMPVIFLLMGIAFVVAGIADMLSIFTGRKRKKYEKLMAESEERMRDRNYVEMLRELGYIIPEKYL